MRPLTILAATLSLAAALALAPPAQADTITDMAPREGWVVIGSDKSYETLIADVKAAAKANKMGIVTEAGPTGVAANRGVEIPGNRVIGIFNNVFAVDILRLSTAAMIEAPIRIYVTEDTDGTATLSYKTPSTVFAPYMEEAGAGLRDAAAQLDAIFATIGEIAAAGG
ncbi:MAG: DUF302 domain-containing protein [Pseudomonadota bacterium]